MHPSNPMMDNQNPRICISYGLCDTPYSSSLSYGRGTSDIANPPIQTSKHHTRFGRLQRRHSITKFNIDAPLPLLDHDPAKSDEEGPSGRDDSYGAPRRPQKSCFLIDKPSSARILDMELPNPPKMASRKQLEPVEAREITNDSIVSRRRFSVSTSSRKILRSESLIRPQHDVKRPNRILSAPPRPHSERRESSKALGDETEPRVYKQQSVRLERRNCITKFNLNFSNQGKEEEQNEYERDLLRDQTRSARQDRSCVYETKIESPRSKSLHQDRTMCAAKSERHLLRRGKNHTGSQTLESQHKESIIISTAASSNQKTVENSCAFQDSNLDLTSPPRKPSSSIGFKVPCTPGRLRRSRSTRALPPRIPQRQTEEEEAVPGIALFKSRSRSERNLIARSILSRAA